MLDVPNEPLVDAAEVCRALNLTEAKLQKLVHLGTITPAIQRGGVQKYWLSSVRRDLNLRAILKEETKENEHRN